MTTELKRTAPIGATGDLARRTGAEVVAQDSRGVTVEARIDVPYAEPVVLGARPHKIRARNATVLAFYWPKKGATVFFPSVNHPGNQPNPFFDRAVSRWGQYLESS